MVDEATIQSAKAVDMDIILDEFGWEKNRYRQIRCPHPDHDDSTPSCSYMAGKNRFKCFGCGESFDTIDLYRCLSEKVNGRTVPFYKAVEEVLELDAMANGNNGGVGTNNSQPSNNHINQQTTSAWRTANGIKNHSPYDLVIGNSRSLSGYELNYLHGRGIMPYDSYVYGGEVYTVKSIEKTLQTETDQNEINRLHEIKNKGVFYKGIAPVLKANRIQIRHNYFEGVNSIIYLVDYDADDEDDLCLERFFRDTERHMAVQKSLDGNHTKRALGTSDFNFITRGMEHNKNKDIYICEGLEDGLSCTMNGIKSISLNSIANLKSLVHYLSEEHVPCYNERFVICFDHDNAGRQATRELKGFFEAYNQNPPHRYQYKYAACEYPQQFHDINDYWVSRVF